MYIYEVMEVKVIEYIKKILKNTCLYYKLLGIKRNRLKNKFYIKSKYEMMKDVEKQYKDRIGRKLDWKNLQTYTEKMQWEKLFDNNPMKTRLSDKYNVRLWVEKKIGSKYLIPLLGRWDNAEKIDFKRLPNKFVLKTNCGSGDVIIVRNKKKLKNHDYKVIREKLKYYMNYDFGISSYELHYSKIKPCIIAEQYIESEFVDLPDYKFLCFDGKPQYCWVDIGRYTNHSRHVYNTEWVFQKWNQVYPISNAGIPKPENFDEMLKIVTVLSEGFPHVRVDLYNINGKIYFGEMTFTNGSGYDMIHPYSADLMLGEMWKIPSDSSINRCELNGI